jgi:hypothetical protein
MTRRSRLGVIADRYLGQRSADYDDLNVLIIVAMNRKGTGFDCRFFVAFAKTFLQKINLTPFFTFL